jgi:protein-tyrosine phosphatase
MNVFRIDDLGGLYLSSDIDDWSVIREKNISAVIDLDGGIDKDVPTDANGLIYIYFPFHDEDIPDKAKLHALAAFGAEMISRGQKVLCHCLMGYNRSALMAGLILYHLGKSGLEALDLVRERRPGALFNPVFADYLLSLDNVRITHPDQTKHQIQADRSDRRG